MKFNHDIIVVDLETLDTHDYIIQIGAVYLKWCKSINQFIKFSSFAIDIKPEKEINKFITDLTGITNESVQNAPMFPEALKSFEDWVLSNTKKLTNVRLCAWGSYFDSKVLRNCCSLYNETYKFSGTWLCAKTIAILWLSLSGRRTDKASVEHVASIMNILPNGLYHNALVDAEAEADILLKIFKDLNHGLFVPIDNGSPYKHIKLE